MMTRQEFDATFAANQDTTEGFSDSDLRAVNDAVFAEVAEMDVDGDITQDHVKNMFAREFNARN